MIAGEPGPTEPTVEIRNNQEELLGRLDKYSNLIDTIKKQLSSVSGRLSLPENLDQSTDSNIFRDMMLIFAIGDQIKEKDIELEDIKLLQRIIDDQKFDGSDQDFGEIDRLIAKIDKIVDSIQQESPKSIWISRGYGESDSAREIDDSKYSIDDILNHTEPEVN